ncbi:MAG: gamma-glutamylcyclotransferase family protein [Polyangiaceae bacterium]
MLDDGATSVTGELYDVDERTLGAVDRLEGHPHFYRRAPVHLLGGDAAQGYLLAQPPRGQAPVIESGDWRRYRCESKS